MYYSLIAVLLHACCEWRHLICWGGVGLRLNSSRAAAQRERERERGRMGWTEESSRIPPHYCWHSFTVPASVSASWRWMRRATVGHALEYLLHHAWSDKNSIACARLWITWRKYYSLHVACFLNCSAVMLIPHALFACMAYTDILGGFGCYKFWACLKQVLYTYSRHAGMKSLCISSFSLP